MLLRETLLLGRERGAKLTGRHDSGEVRLSSCGEYLTFRGERSAVTLSSYWMKAVSLARCANRRPDPHLHTFSNPDPASQP